MRGAYHVPLLFVIAPKAGTSRRGPYASHDTGNHKF